MHFYRCFSFYKLSDGQYDRQSLAVNNIFVGMGPDFTGVPTNMLTVNGTLRLSVYNPATFFGIRVSSTPVNLIYSDVVVATGQVRWFYPIHSLAKHHIYKINEYDRE